MRNNLFDKPSHKVKKSINGFDGTLVEKYKVKDLSPEQKDFVRSALEKARF